jgi:Inhibitor of growth proteins N-terminal histone-binding
VRVTTSYKGPNPGYKPPPVAETDDELTRVQKMAMEAVNSVPEQLELYNSIETEYAECKEIIKDKLHLSDRIRDTIDRHMKRLTADLERMEGDENGTNTVPPPVEKEAAPVRAAHTEPSISVTVPRINV